MKLYFFFIGFLSIMILSPSSYAMVPIECPQKISVTESTSSHGNWSGYKRTTSKMLHESQIYEGNLGDTRFLQAPRETTKSGQLIQIWDLQANGGQSFWIQCHYTDTSASIRRKIPFTIKQCLRISQMDKDHNITKSTNTICR